MSILALRFGEINNCNEEETDSDKLLRPINRRYKASNSYFSMLDQSERINPDRLPMNQSIDEDAFERIQKQVRDDRPNKNRRPEPNETDVSRE